MVLHNQSTVLNNLNNAIGQYDKYCDGYGNIAASGNSYILGLVLQSVSTPCKLSHEGSKMLDEINSFDLCEVQGAYLGQINMSTVSSFCGPQGLLLGYDIFYREQPTLIELNYNSEFPQFENIYSIHLISSQTEQLFGKVGNYNFILKPGAHVPCATKNLKTFEEGWIYSALAIGIPENREESACLLMEDVGMFKDRTKDVNMDEMQKLVHRSLIKSISQIGQNQQVKYKEVLIGSKFVYNMQGNVACALVAAPYFVLAKEAVKNVEFY